MNTDRMPKLNLDIPTIDLNVPSVKLNLPKMAPELPKVRPLPALRRISETVATLTGAKATASNPLTGEPMNLEEAAYVEQLKTVRRNATKAARSGNPAKREPAKKVLSVVGSMIGQTYGQDAAKTYRNQVGA